VLTFYPFWFRKLSMSTMKYSESEILLQHGVRPLLHRVEVYRYLLENRVHPTADDIYTALTREGVSIARSTVYNILTLLVENNLVQALSIEEKELRYDACMTPHIHFKCNQCGEIYDINEGLFPSIDLKGGFQIDSVEVTIKGTCPHCL
jgi:Fur family peroxide stress response transcriptional regulator